MGTELLDIQPRELKFIFELKRQSSCSVRLVNKSSQYVAFKVKTTNPKKYSVRPNTGVIEPRCACDFVVTMQAQRVAPPDMTCRDKFLVQSTVVNEGTIDENITSEMFTKENGKYVEESKLRVILVSPPQSPVLSPINGVHNQMSAYETSALKDQVLRSAEELSPQSKVANDGKESKPENIEESVVAESPKIESVKESTESPKIESVKESTESLTAKSANFESAEDSTESVAAKSTKLEPVKDSEESVAAKSIKSEPLKDSDELVAAEFIKLEPVKGTEELVASQSIKIGSLKDLDDLDLIKDIEKMKRKLNDLELKLSEAEVTISKLTDDRRLSTVEKESLQRELALLRSKRGGKGVQAGFPLLFVVMVAFVSIILGYLLHS